MSSPNRVPASFASIFRKWVYIALRPASLMASSGSMGGTAGVSGTGSGATGGAGGGTAAGSSGKRMTAAASSASTVVKTISWLKS